MRSNDRCRDTKNRQERPFKTELVDGAMLVGRYGMPLIQRTDFLAEKGVPFEASLRSRAFDHWVHFYTHDYVFERIWNEPARYLAVLRRFKGVISPDFSVYTNMPPAMQIWNTYRNRALTYWYQKQGLNILPNVRWGDEQSYDFCFDGIARGSAVAVSTNGCIAHKLERYVFKQGLKALIARVEPCAITVYSNLPEDIRKIITEQGISLSHVENHWRTVREKVRP